MQVTLQRMRSPDGRKPATQGQGKIMFAIGQFAVSCIGSSLALEGHFGVHEWPFFKVLFSERYMQMPAP